MGLANKVVAIILVMFVLGAIGGTAFTLASCSTSYAGADSSVSTLMVVLVPVMAGIAIALYMLPRKT